MSASKNAYILYTGDVKYRKSLVYITDEYVARLMVLYDDYSSYLFRVYAVSIDVAGVSYKAYPKTVLRNDG